MKIQILTSCAGLDFSFAVGESAEVRAELGRDLIKAGYAEEIKTVKKSSKGDADADT